MFFRKIFVGVLLVCGLISYANAEDTEEYTILKFFQQVKTAGDVSTVVSNIPPIVDLTKTSIINALLKSQVDTYKELSSLYNTRLQQGKTIGLTFIKNAQKDILQEIEKKDITYDELLSKFGKLGNYADLGLNIIGMGLDAYDIGTSVARLQNGDGSVAVNTLNITQKVYSIITTSGTVVAKLMPQGTIAKTKFVSFFNNAKYLEKTNFILLALQLNSLAYSAARDSIVEETKSNFEKEYKTKLNSRNTVIEALITAYRNNDNLTKTDIEHILQNYTVFTEKKSSGGLKTVALINIFKDYVEHGSKYLKDRFNVSDFSELPGFYKVVAALDSLAHISLLEDDEFVYRLDKTIQTSPNWAATLENWFAGAFNGEDAYKIFNTEDLKKKLIPSEIVPSGSDLVDSRLEYYRLMYFNLFAGEVGREFMEYAFNIGKAVKSVKERTATLPVHSNDIQVPSLTFTLPQDANITQNTIIAKVGDKITFSADYSAKKFIKEVNLPLSDEGKSVWDGDELVTIDADTVVYRLWYRAYRDANNLSDTPHYVTLDYDKENGSFSFSMPVDKMYVLSMGFGHKEHPHVEIGVDFPFEWHSIIREDDSNDTTDSYQQCIDNGGTEIGCRVGLHMTGSIDTENANDVTISGNYAYVADGEAGLKIIDISDPVNPILKGSIDIDNAYKVTVTGNYAYVADESIGLKIIDISNPENPILKGFIGTDYYAEDITVSGNYAYIADGGDGLKIIDISDPENPILKGSISTYFAQSVTVSGNYAYVAEDDGGLKIINISDPNNPILKGFIGTDYSAQSVTVSGKYAYVAEEDGGLKIIDISDPNNPILKGSISTSYALGITIYGNYAYVADGEAGLKIIDISNPSNPILKGSIGTYWAQGIAVYGNYAYVADSEAGLKIIDISHSSNPAFEGSIDTEDAGVVTVSGNYAYVLGFGLKIIDISDPSNPTLKGSVHDELASDITISGDYAYVADSEAGLKIIDISDPVNPTIKGSIDTEDASVVTVSGNYAYVIGWGTGLKIIDISDPVNPTLKGSISIGNACDVIISGNYAYIANGGDGLKIIDISDPNNPILKGSISTSYALGITIYGNYAYVADGEAGLKIIDISNPSNPILKGSIDTENAYKVTVTGNYAYVADDYAGLKIIDISDPSNPSLKGSIDIEEAYDVSVSGDYAYLADGYGGLKIIYIPQIINLYNILQQYYHPITYIRLKRETYGDDVVASATFRKEWVFDKDIDNFDIDVVSNSYSNAVAESDFVKNGKKLSVSLTPDISKLLNKLVLKFTHNGNPVKISGSDTFWSQTPTNHPPRLADGQITQLVSATNEPAYLDIETFDGDGDAVALSVEDDAGGYVGFDPKDPQHLFASFSDSKTMHTIKIGLSDGKEKVIKAFHVLQFNQNSIEDFYTDVSKHGGYLYDGIAFGTLKGVIWGQPDPSDPTKRIFRPTDNASMAEALKMIINAEKKAGLVTLHSTNSYRDIYPNWTMPYYTFARENQAIDEKYNLAIEYPTREEIAKIISKTLHLGEKFGAVDNNDSFSDADQFSDASMLYHAKLVKEAGLFMTTSLARPQDPISRADLAMVIEKIFMIPQATATATPSSVEQGDPFDINVTINKAEAIDSRFRLYDNSANVTTKAIIDKALIDTEQIDSNQLLREKNTIAVLLENGGVKNMVHAQVTVNFSDKDSDGVQDKEDKWPEDIRYAYDDNNNSIPDILDVIYNLSNYKATDSVIINGHTIAIVDIITDGGVVIDTDGDGTPDENDDDIDGDGTPNTQDAFPYDKNETTDTDGDGIGNNADTDDDNDGAMDVSDAFPLDPNETMDTDGDGIGNNADTDDDNDGISDADELKYGLYPLDPSDAVKDNDGDGISNIEEIRNGTDPNHPDITLILKPIPIHYLSIGGNDQTITLEANCSIDTPLAYHATSNDLQSVIVSVNDNNITLSPVGTTETNITVTVGVTALGITTEENISIVLVNAQTNDLNSSDRNDTNTSETQDPNIDNNTTSDQNETNTTNPDIDGDGTPNTQDAFPYDKNETTDTDGDGIGNNADTDDDNDGISDTDELKYGLNPLDANDAQADSDGDGISNLDEITQGTNPKDASSHLQLTLEKIDDLYLYPNGTISYLLHYNSSVTGEISWHTTVADVDVATAEVIDNRLVVNATAQEEAQTTLKVTASMYGYTTSQDLNLYVKEAHIEVENNTTAHFEPINNTSLVLDRADYHATVAIEENQTLQYHYSSKTDDQETHIDVTIAGATVKVAKDDQVTIILPLATKASIEIAPDGSIKPSVEDEHIILPTDRLPLGTKVKTDSRYIDMTIPMPETLQF